MRSSISIICFSILSSRTAIEFMRSLQVASPLRKPSESPVFSRVAPSLSRSWQRSIVTSPSSGIVRMLLPASEKVSGISFGDQILARGEEKPTLWAVFPLGCWEAVSDQEDANLVGEGRGLWDVGYSRDGSEKAVRLEDCVSVWVC